MPYNKSFKVKTSPNYKRADVPIYQADHLFIFISFSNGSLYLFIKFKHTLKVIILVKLAIYLR